VNRKLQAFSCADCASGLILTKICTSESSYCALENTSEFVSMVAHERLCPYARHTWHLIQNKACLHNKSKINSKATSDMFCQCGSV